MNNGFEQIVTPVQSFVIQSKCGHYNFHYTLDEFRRRVMEDDLPLSLIAYRDQLDDYLNQFV